MSDNVTNTETTEIALQSENDSLRARIKQQADILTQKQQTIAQKMKEKIELMAINTQLNVAFARLQEELEQYKSRGITRLDNDVLVLGPRTPEGSELGYKLYREISEYAEKLEDKYIQSAKSKRGNKRSTIVDDHWGTLLATYNEINDARRAAGRECSIQQLCDEHYKKYKIVITRYYSQRFIETMKFKKAAEAAAAAAAASAKA